MGGRGWSALLLCLVLATAPACGGTKTPPVRANTETSTPETTEPTLPASPSEKTEDPPDEENISTQRSDDETGSPDTSDPEDDTESDAEDAGPSAPTEDFDSDLDSAIEAADAYWTHHFRAPGYTFTSVDVVAYSVDDPAYCGSDLLATKNAYYCRSSETVYHDENWMSDQYDTIGDAFVYMVIAHEFGHAVQDQLQAPRLTSISYELQADCLAGALLGDPDFILIEDGDLNELIAGLAEVADQPGTPWYSSDAHGSPRQRSAAFFTGVRTPAACLS